MSYDKASADKLALEQAEVRGLIARVQGQRCGMRAASKTTGKRFDLPRIELVTGRSVTPHGLRVMQLCGCNVSKVIL